MILDSFVTTSRRHPLGAVFLVIVCWVCGSPIHGRQTNEPRPDLILRGELVGERDHQTYRAIPFEIPSELESIRVVFSYSGREQRATVDLGLFDPNGFRGWSGGNKQEFSVGVHAATPSYLPGPLNPGTWSLILGVPNLRIGTTSSYQAAIYFERGGDPDAARPDHDDAGDAEEAASSPSDPTLAAAQSSVPNLSSAKWYRGDLHLHTGHSDGTCVENDQERQPCPPRLTLEAARQAGLDFVAITEHNTTSHHQPLAELQSEFDRPLVIRGREITTFQGHLNIFGTSDYVEFRLGSRALPTLTDLFNAIDATAAIASINHPRLPSGEACMGCGWSSGTELLGRAQAVEVINGGTMRTRGGAAEGLFSGIPFWERMLDQGLATVAVGGSDNHDPTLNQGVPSAVGQPTTVVFAQQLTEQALLAGVRAGRVFIDLSSKKHRTLDYRAQQGNRTSLMGEALVVTVGEPIPVTISSLGGRGLTLHSVGHGVHFSTATIKLEHDSEQVQLVATVEGLENAENPWLRFELRDAEGNLKVLGNAIRIEMRVR